MTLGGRTLLAERIPWLQDGSAKCGLYFPASSLHQFRLVKILLKLRQSATVLSAVWCPATDISIYEHKSVVATRQVVEHTLHTRSWCYSTWHHEKPTKRWLPCNKVGFLFVLYVRSSCRRLSSGGLICIYLIIKWQIWSIKLWTNRRSSKSTSWIWSTCCTHNWGYRHELICVGVSSQSQNPSASTSIYHR